MAPKRKKTKAPKAEIIYWIGVLGSFGLLVSVAAGFLAASSGFGTLWEWWGFRDGLEYFKDSAFLGGAGLLLSAVSLGWALAVKKNAGRIKASIGLVLGVLAVGFYLVWLYQAHSVPPIHDITTDFNNPPAFDFVLHLRKGSLNSPEYGGPPVAEQQQKAYPDIQPLSLNIAPDKAWEACLKSAQKLGWEIVLMDEAHCRIEATDRTFWFGFKDDIVVRVTPMGNGSRVDMRSESRVGQNDMGTNAKRIRRFLKGVYLLKSLR